MGVLRSIGRALFSIWVWGGCFTWMLFGVLASLTLLVIGIPYQKVHMWVTGRVFGQCVPMSTVRLRIHYHPKFDPEARSIFAQNHINLLDGMVAARVIPHAFSGLMNAWQFKIPIYGWMMTLSKGIAVKRHSREGVIAQISREAAERKRIGMSVLTFPEGHRTVTGKTGNFKRGVFLMARNAEMPIVPVAVKGLYDVNNKRTGWIFTPFQTVDVFVGPQFSTIGIDNEHIGEFADRMHDYIAHCLENGDFPNAEKYAAA